MQISIADVDANGRALSTSTTFALCGQVRSQGESDDSLNRLATKAGCESFSSISWSNAQKFLSAPQRLVVPKVDVFLLCPATDTMILCSTTSKLSTALIQMIPYTSKISLGDRHLSLSIKRPTRIIS